MNTQPTELPACPTGFEYFGYTEDGLSHPPSEASKDLAILYPGGAAWDQSGLYNSVGAHAALRIGSPIHAANFPAKVEGLPDGLPTPPDAPDGMRWVYRNREYRGIADVMMKCDNGDTDWLKGRCAHGMFDHYLEAVPITPPDKVEPNEPDLLAMDEVEKLIKSNAAAHLEEIRSLKETLEMAVKHLRELVSVHDGEALREAMRFLDAHFPEPTPAFDWDQLWAELPSWIQWVAMDEDGSWWTHRNAPRIAGDTCATWYGLLEFKIPHDHAPPTAPDWKQSLIQRPTLSQTKL